MAKTMHDLTNNENKHELFKLIKGSNKSSPVVYESKPYVCDGCERKVIDYKHENGYEWTFNCNCGLIGQGKEAQKRHERIKHNEYYRASVEFIPPKYFKSNFENYIPHNESSRKAKNICERYAKNFSLDNPQSLYLYGGFGLGKTELSTCIMNEIRHEFKVMFIDVNQLIQNFKFGWNKNSEYAKNNYQEKMKEYIRTADLVIFDDIGANANNSSSSEILNILINSRMQKHTIFTTNLKSSEMTNSIDYERNFSRMMELCTPISFDGLDQRRVGKFKNLKEQLPYDINNPPF